MSYKYGFIGGGNMASAIFAGVIRQAASDPSEIIVSDASEERRDWIQSTYGVVTTSDNRIPAKESSCLVLAVKPQILAAVVAEIATEIPKETTVVSVLAGVTTELLSQQLNAHKQIVRTMPNLPATVGKGMTGIAESEGVSEDALRVAEALLGTVGATIRVKESLLDAVTAISGSGPGYVFRIAEILTRAGVEVGLSEECSALLVKQTLLGAAELLGSTDVSAASLCQRVCSPGGTTLAGLDAMMKEGLEQALTNGVQAACDRSKELSSGS